MPSTVKIVVKTHKNSSRENPHILRRRCCTRPAGTTPPRGSSRGRSRPACPGATPGRRPASPRPETIPHLQIFVIMNFCIFVKLLLIISCETYLQNFEWKVANIGAGTAKTERRSCSTLAGTARPDPAMRFGSLPDEGGVRAAARRGLTSACRPAGPSRPPRTTRLSPPLFL